jgi:hypothetical protein
MGIVYNTSIVRNGLILHLDAANRKSYPGTGTTWTDLSGQNNHFTLYNNPSYSNNAFTFNGTSQYAASANAINLTANNSVTIEAWFRANTSTSGILFEHTANWNTNLGGWGLATNDNGSGTSVNIMHTNHNNFGARNYTFAIGNNWNCQTNIFSIVSDTTGRLTYTNGRIINFDSGGSTSTSSGSFANSTLFIASRGGTTVFFNGLVGIIRLYSRKLTADEVRQNFEATRDRYGI